MNSNPQSPLQSQEVQQTPVEILTDRLTDALLYLYPPPENPEEAEEYESNRRALNDLLEGVQSIQTTVSRLEFREQEVVPGCLRAALEEPAYRLLQGMPNRINRWLAQQPEVEEDKRQWAQEAVDCLNQVRVR